MRRLINYLLKLTCPRLARRRRLTVLPAIDPKQSVYNPKEFRRRR